MEIVIQIAQLILSLSILIVLHELGHFIPAKLFKTRVEKFYLFFDPWFSVLKKKIGETEYGIGWLPLGGYVKISGMIDESMDKEQLNQPAQPWEFRSKPAWQRLIIMLGGVTVNILLAFLIYAMLLFTYGEEYLKIEDAKYGFVADSVAMNMGIRTGDKIIGYDHGKKFESTNAIAKTVLLEEVLSIQVERDGQIIDIPFTGDIKKQLTDKKGLGFVSIAFPAEVGELQKDNPLIKAGGKTGDLIISVNNEPVSYFEELRIKLRSYKNKTVPLSVLRGADTVNLTVAVSPAGTIGFGPPKLDKFFTPTIKKYGFFESFPAGVVKTGSTLSDYIKQFRLIFDKDVQGYKQVGGFGSIGGLFPKVWGDWYTFWSLTAFLSVVLAFMNILPIPALDGGHALFTIVEMITGRKPSEKFLERAQLVGMVLLLSLMLLANGNDVLRLFK
jgi:regulator of sigma E protease